MKSDGIISNNKFQWQWQIYYYLFTNNPDSSDQLCRFHITQYRCR